MNANITSPTRHTIMRATGLAGTAAAARTGAPPVPASGPRNINPTFAALLRRDETCRAECERQYREEYTPKFEFERQQAAAAAISHANRARLDASRRESDALGVQSAAIIDEIAAFPVDNLTDLDAKMERLLLLGWFETEGTADYIAADVRRLAAREA